MIIILSSQDSAFKDQNLQEIKAKILTRPDSSQFDYDVFYGAKLEPEDLKKSLLSLPAVGSQRLIIIREAERLSQHNQNLVLEFAQKDDRTTVLVLEMTQTEAIAPLVIKLKSKAKFIQGQEEARANVFDLTKAISRDTPAQALQILDGLLTQGIHPLQVMGGLVWYWGSIRSTLRKADYQKGLRALREADVGIKRSRLEPGYALEMLVVKLSLTRAG